MMKKKGFWFVHILWVLWISPACFGSDLDDGIPIEDMPISEMENVNKDVNITFIKMNARSQAGVNPDKGVVSKDPTGSINSVVTGPGSTFKGDIIIIDEGKGDRTVIVDE
jgi:hypothetical protein